MSQPLHYRRPTEPFCTPIVKLTPSCRWRNPQCDVLTVIKRLCCTETPHIAQLLDEAHLPRDYPIGCASDLANSLSRICGKTITVAEDTTAEIVFRVGDEGTPYVSFNQPAKHADFVNIVMTKIANLLKNGSDGFAIASQRSQSHAKAFPSCGSGACALHALPGKHFHAT